MMCFIRGPATAILLSAVWSLTLIGLIAVFVPIADVINHFRLHLLAAAILCLLLSISLGHTKFVWVSGLLVLVNIALMIPALTRTAPKVSAIGPENAVRVLTHNLQARSRKLSEIEDHLRQANADILFLQEVSSSKVLLLHRLRNLYPYSADCVDFYECRMVILSKTPLTHIQRYFVDGSGLPTLVARTRLDTGEVNLVAMHFDRPTRPNHQRHDLAIFPELLNRYRHLPRIVGGDFNLTPWSYGFYTLLRATNLRPVQSLGWSWPTNFILPQFLIDHILVDPQFEIITARIGESAGSDHAAVLATLAFQSD